MQKISLSSEIENQVFSMLLPYIPESVSAIQPLLSESNISVDIAYIDVDVVFAFPCFVSAAVSVGIPKVNVGSITVTEKNPNTALMASRFVKLFTYISSDIFIF